MEVIDQTMICSIEDIPNEVLEFILGFLPPYKDLENCMCVCKRWYACAQSVKWKISMKLLKAVSEFKILWKTINPVDTLPTITKRFSHSACVYENFMYIFGGCSTNATAFNDLWRFDLSRRQWSRPLATGTYPVPKSYTSLCAYQDNLILFGGWTYSSSDWYYNENAKLLNDLHFYNVRTNKWTLMSTSNPPPPTWGHSAIVRGHEMIVFGGLVNGSAGPLFQCSNHVWVLDLATLTWRLQPTSEPRPAPRYAQSLIELDDGRCMILGGAQTFRNRIVYNDCWILTMTGPVWTWKAIAIRNREWASANIWCNPACRVGDKIVSLSRCRHVWNSAKPLISSAVRRAVANPPEDASVSVRVEQSLRRPIDRDQNVNGKRGVLPRQSLVNNKRQADELASNEPVAGPSTEQNAVVLNNSIQNKSQQAEQGANDTEINKKLNPLRVNKFNNKNNMKIVRQLQDANRFKMAAFACDSPPNNAVPDIDLVNQRQIGHLDNRHVPPQRPPEPVAAQVNKKTNRNTLTMHVLDISNVVNGNSLNYVSWLCPPLGGMLGAPEEFVMYSLVKGNGELIMFGGIYNEFCMSSNPTFQPDLYSNSLHFIVPPRDII